MSPPDVCDYCRLPLPGRRRGAGSAGDGGPSYCCLGCRIAAGVTREGGEEGANRWLLARIGLAAFLTMNVMVFTMALWSMGRPEAGSGATARAYYDLFRHLSLLASAPVLLLLGPPLVANALDGLRRGVLGTDLLLVAGVVAAFAYSSVSVVRGSGHVYFEVGCVILLAVTIGRWLEATCRLRAGEALDQLERLLPSEVRRIREGGSEETVMLEALTAGDLVRVAPGMRFPADGRIVRGTAWVDEQFLSGESRPVEKQAGDPVVGGSLNLDGDLLVRVAGAASQGTLARLVALVRSARESRGRHQLLADRVAAWFLPLTLGVALASLGYHGSRRGPEAGVLAGLAVVLIACPCALGLATPLAIWTAMGTAARHQVIFRSGEALERLASVRALRFDKTGTLTTGQPRLESRLIDPGSDPREVEQIALALAAASDHPLAQALNRALAAGRQPPVAGRTPSAIRQVPGRGMIGEFPDHGTPCFLGSLRLTAESGQELGPALARGLDAAMAAGRPLTLLAWGGKVRAVFAFEEELRPGAAEVLARCRAVGCDVAVLTGDHASRGRALQETLGLPVTAGLLPEDKVAALRAAREAVGPVGMVGDGVNDAPALAVADVGIALGCGADVSRDSAQVCITSDRLDRLPFALDLARRTVSVVRGNLAWAFGYNALGVAVAATGQLHPAIAAFLMTASSALVIGNSLRLGRDEDARERTGTPPPGPGEVHAAEEIVGAHA